MEEGKKIYVNSFNGPFLNSESMIVEYDDILQLPEFYVLYSLKEAKADLSDIYDMKEFFELESFDDAIDWYANRKERQLYLNFTPTEKLKSIVEKIYKDAQVDITMDLKLAAFSELFIEKQIIENPEIIERAVKMNFFRVLKNISKTKLVKKIIIFSKYNEEICKLIDAYIKKEIRDDINVVSAHNLFELNEIEEINPNSTFVFSNMYHISDLIELDKINRSSILLCNNYKYNKITDDLYVIDLVKMKKDFTFKIDFFNNYLILD